VLARDPVTALMSDPGVGFSGVGVPNGVRDWAPPVTAVAAIAARHRQNLVIVMITFLSGALAPVTHNTAERARIFYAQVRTRAS
jgi:hypothetical protein